jgi:hypothetical protein
MDVQELIARFPEIPEVLHEKPVLKRYAEVFGDLLRTAWKPSACSADQQTAENLVYMKLIAPMGILAYGLSTPEKTVAQLEALLEAYRPDPEKFLAELIPPDVAQAPGGCQGEEGPGTGVAIASNTGLPRRY